MNKYVGAFLGLTMLLSLFIEPVLNRKINLIRDIETSYSVFLNDVHKLTWCANQYEKRKLAPLPVEDILRVFDFKEDGINSILEHSVISKDFADYLGKNTKQVPIEICYKKVQNSWCNYKKSIDAYNSLIKTRNSRKTTLYVSGFPMKFDSELKIPEIYVNPVDKL